MAQTGKIRIIGGNWRSRLLQFPALANVRPSPDAVRETLFNWLRDDICNARCLDLFAGSGAIGFEAASRGASQVTMVEANPAVARQLVKNVTLLNAATQVNVVTCKAERYLGQAIDPAIDKTKRQFDCVFLDPPFDDKLVPTICSLLINGDLLSDNAIVYIETRKSNAPLPIPDSWHIIRHKRQGMVQSTLIKTNQL